MRTELIQRMLEAALQEQDFQSGPLEIDEGARLRRPAPRGLILPIAAPAVDLYATHRYHQDEKRWCSQVQGAAASTTVQISQVPRSEVWYVIAAHCWHDDPIGRTLRLHIRAPAGFAWDHVTGVPTVADRDFVLAATTGVAAQNNRMAAPRPFYLGGGWRLHAETDLMGAGQSVHIMALFFRLRAGEYVVSP